MTNEELKSQAYLAALTGLLAARGNSPDFDNGAGRNSDEYFTLMNHLHGISEIAAKMADIVTDGAEFYE